MDALWALHFESAFFIVPWQNKFDLDLFVLMTQRKIVSRVESLQKKSITKIGTRVHRRMSCCNAGTFSVMMLIVVRLVLSVTSLSWYGKVACTILMETPAGKISFKETVELEGTTTLLFSFQQCVSNFQQYLLLTKESSFLIQRKKKEDMGDERKMKKQKKRSCLCFYSNMRRFDNHNHANVMCACQYQVSSSRLEVKAIVTIHNKLNKVKSELD